MRLRTARAGGKTVEPDPPTGPIVIRNDEDQKAYNDYVARQAKLIDRLNNLERDRVFFDIDLNSAHGKALSKIASQIFEEFSAAIAKR